MTADENKPISETGEAQTGTDGGNSNAGAGTGSRSAESPTALHKGTGQKSSKERGSATNSKKNPGKRPHQGGSSA